MTDDTPAGKDEAAPPERAAASADEADTSAGDAALPDEDGATIAVDEPATVDAPAAPATAATAASPPSRDRRGVFVPVWLAALLAVLLVGGIGFAIGYVSADGDDSNSTNAAAVQPDQNSGNSNSNSSTSGNDNRNDSDSDNDNSGSAAPTAFLGVAIEGVDNGGGAEVTNVRSGSPAADAGLRSGDVITEVGDATVQDAADLIREVRSHEPGDEVTITYTRNGTSTDVQVELGESDIRNSLPS